MKRPAIIMLCCGAGVAGVAIGILGTLRLCGLGADAAVLVRAEADVAVITAALEHMQAGQSDRAAELLENQLDGALIRVDAFVARGSRLMPQTYARLVRVQRLRDRSGYRPSTADVASAVDRALMLRGDPNP